MSATILEKYGEARLPRASYPIAPRFSTAIGTGAYGDWLEQLPATIRYRSTYISRSAA